MKTHVIVVLLISLNTTFFRTHDVLNIFIHPIAIKLRFLSFFLEPHTGV